MIPLTEIYEILGFFLTSQEVIPFECFFNGSVLSSALFLERFKKCRVMPKCYWMQFQ